MSSSLLFSSQFSIAVSASLKRKFLLSLQVQEELRYALPKRSLKSSALCVYFSVGRASTPSHCFFCYLFACSITRQSCTALSIMAKVLCVCGTHSVTYNFNRCCDYKRQSAIENISIERANDLLLPSDTSFDNLLFIWSECGTQRGNCGDVSSLVFSFSSPLCAPLHFLPRFMLPRNKASCVAH